MQSDGTRFNAAFPCFWCDLIVFMESLRYVARSGPRRLDFMM